MVINVELRNTAIQRNRNVLDTIVVRIDSVHNHIHIVILIVQLRHERVFKVCRYTRYKSERSRRRQGLTPRNVLIVQIAEVVRAEEGLAYIVIEVRNRKRK